MDEAVLFLSTAFENHGGNWKKIAFVGSITEYKI